MAEVMIHDFLDNGIEVHLIQSHRKGINPDIPSSLEGYKGFSCDTVIRKDAAKRLVFPQGETDENVVVGREGERFIRVVFNGSEATGSPLIARLAKEKGIEANISAASTKTIGTGVFGSMLLGIVGGDDAVNTTLAYFNESNGVNAEEVSVND